MEEEVADGIFRVGGGFWPSTDSRVALDLRSLIERELEYSYV